MNTIYGGIILFQITEKKMNTNNKKPASGFSHRCNTCDTYFRSKPDLKGELFKLGVIKFCKG